MKEKDSNVIKAIAVTVIGFVLIILLVVLLNLGTRADTNIHEPVVEDMLDLPCDKWKIVTDGTSYSFVFPDTGNRAVSDYRSLQSAKNGACSQYRYREKLRNTVWRDVE